jgi:hypothetical protein
MTPYIIFPTMLSWQKSSPPFSTLYQVPRPHRPPQRATSQSTKLPRPDEELSSLTLKTLQHFDISQISLSSEHNTDWATNILDACGPVRHQNYSDYWVPEFFRYPSAIESESQVREYFTTFLNPAICGAICLYENHKNTQSTGYPQPNNIWEAVDTSGHGAAGRTDLSFRPTHRPANPVAGFEFKTERVGTSNQYGNGSLSVSVLGSVTTWLHAGVMIEMPPRESIVWEEQLWKKKLRKFIVQVSGCSNVLYVDLHW